MVIKHKIHARSVLRVQPHTDSWFISRYSMNLYSGCEHACAYCDGRAERYHVQGDFERDIRIKVNAVELLRQELNRQREPGFLFLGGGVTDAYQPIEEEHQLARGALELALDLGWPVHVLTKSALVERDLDLLQAINNETRAILSFSIQSVDERVITHFEPGASPASERLRVLNKAKELGIGAGVMAMPVLPGISDSQGQLNELAKQATGLDYLLFGGLSLRPGAQTDSYMSKVNPDLIPTYRGLLAERGAPLQFYYKKLGPRFKEASSRAKIPERIPRELYTGQIPIYVEAAVYLEQRSREFGQQDLRQSGRAIQLWARARMKSRGVRYEDVEDDFMVMLRAGQLKGMKVGAKALAVLRSLDLRPKARPQQALFG